MTSPHAFDASFRCGSRLPTDNVSQPFMLTVGTVTPAYLQYDRIMSEFFNGFVIGPISTQTQNYSFATNTTPVSCAVKVGGGYSTNQYCRLNACVGSGCNKPQTYIVAHSADATCTSRNTDTYRIGCNPDAPEALRTQCVEAFQTAIAAQSNTVADGVAFRFRFIFNNTTPTDVECVKYGPGKMPAGLNLYENVVCNAVLQNGEYYENELVSA